MQASNVIKLLHLTPVLTPAVTNVIVVTYRPLVFEQEFIMLDLSDVEYDSTQFSDVIFAGMGKDLTAEDARPRMRQDGTPQRTKSGEPTYATGVVGPSRWGGPDTGTTIAVIERGIYKFGHFYRMDGRVWVKQYAVTSFGDRAETRQAITCDRLVEVPNPATSAPSKPTVELLEDESAGEKGGR